jgi:iron complex outermembrane receptor protein
VNRHNVHRLGFHGAAAALVAGGPLLFGLGHAEVNTADSDGTQLVEIVVTAERREQNLQNVPIAVSALSGAELQAAGITGTDTLQSAVPSLVISKQANGALPFIRGIGSTLGDANAESSVAIYVDGVYQPSAFANYFELNDVERIEVLKGPQGTLFGRNATGGVIQVITKNPSSSPDADISVGYANYRTVMLNGYGSTPITDQIAFGTALYYMDQSDGWGTNFFNGQSTPDSGDLSLRSKLLIKPGDSTRIIIAANYDKSRSGAINGQAPDVGGATFNVPFPGRWNRDANYTDSTRITSDGGSITVDQDFAFMSFKSISAYEKTYGFWTVDLDSSPVDILSPKPIDKSNMYSQELHLLSRADAQIQWLLGAYYYYRNAGWDPQQLRGLALAPLPDGLDDHGATKSVSKSLFGQATYPILPKTHLTLGFRYSWEDVDAIGYTALGGTNDIIDTPNGRPATNSLSYSKPTWRVSLDHEFAPDLLGYISDNRGIKSGNFATSAGAAGIAKPYLPEQLDAYELGLKSEFLDRRIKLNTAAYYYDFKNYQFQKLVAGTSFIFNGPSAKVYGLEIDAVGRATKQLTLTGALSVLHSQIGNFPGAPNSCLTPSGASDNGGFFCSPTTGYATTVPFNAVGKPLPNAPDFTGNLGFTYEEPSSVGSFQLGSNVYYYSGASAELGDRLRYPKYTTLSASLGWTDLSGKWNVRLWGKNLTDAYYYNQLSVVNGLSDIGGPAPPRTYGITFSAKF